MQRIIKWASPALLAVICQQSIHWAAGTQAFWANPLVHVCELAVSLLLSYYGSWRMRSYIEKVIYHNAFIRGVAKEYYLWTFYFLIAVCNYVFFTHRLTNIPESAGDYVTAIIVCVPILLLYYTLIRSEYNKRKYETIIAELTKSHMATAEADIKERLYESKLDFFTDIAHEFCTPLTLISGPCDLILGQKNMNPTVSKYATVISRNARRMNSLISDLMDFKQLDSGYKRPEVSALNISVITDRIIDAFSIQASGTTTGIIKQYKNDVIWHSDEKFFSTILINLLSNAVKYSTGEFVTVEISKVGTESLVLKVTNRGVGINKEEMASIFNRFTVLDNYGKQEGWKRNGLGLAITESMVKLLSGKISIDSILNETTSFTVSLPNLPTETKGMIKAYDIKEAIIPEFIPKNVKFTHKEDCATVAVIDDNAEMLWYICNVVNEEFNVLPINQSAEAIELLSKNHTDIILCDILMEKMDGITLTHLLKSDKSTSHIPLIIVSASHDIEKQTEAINAGAELYITKPFDNAYLKTAIKRHLSRKEDLKDYFASPLSTYDMDMGKLQHAEHRKFLKKIHSIINKNTQNENLSPEYIAQELGMSVRSLYRKLKEITDKGLQEIIREGRLTVAENLLLKSKLTIGEIVFKSGFLNRASFYRAFSEKNGCTPKEFIKNNE